MRIGNFYSGYTPLLRGANQGRGTLNSTISSGKRKAPAGVNTLEDLLSGHYKNSYGVEGMCVTGRKNWRKIIDVSDEMKQHVLEDVKKAYYQYNGMSGDNEAEWEAYARGLNEYYKTLKVEDRLSAAWTLNQLHLEISGIVTRSIQEKIPGWTAGQPVSHVLLDEIFADRRITSLVGEKPAGGIRWDKTGDRIVLSQGSVQQGLSSAEENRQLAKELIQAVQAAKTKAEENLEAAEPKKMQEEEQESERQSGAVAFNAAKRARQLAAASSRAQVQAVLSLLRQDLDDCKYGLENGMCDQAEVDKVKAMIQQAQRRMSEVSGNSEEEQEGGFDAFAIASLM